MKKYGFTLAEILISLGIIGVVSAIILPTFTANSQNQANASKLSAASNAAENAFSSMMLAEGYDDIRDTSFGQKFSSGNAGKLGDFLKYTNSNTTYTSLGYSSNAPFKTINNVALEENALKPAFAVTTKNGAVIAFKPAIKEFTETEITNLEKNGCSVTSKLATVVIDVNGPAKPNKVGRDVYAYILGGDGILYPYGSKMGNLIASNGSEDKDYSESTNSNYSCNPSKCSSYYGLGCTGKLIEDGYKMKY